MNKWIYTISGNKDQFTLEHRIFNSSSFFVTLFALAASSVNWIIDLHPNTIWPGYLGAVFSTIIYIISRVRGQFNPLLVMVYTLIAIAILSSIYFYNNGASGTILYLFMMLLNIYLLVIVPRLQWVIFCLMLAAVVILLMLEYVNPGWVHPYNSHQDAIIDHTATLFLAMLFSSLVTIAFRQGYIGERKTVLKQNADLKQLNLQIDEQKAELEMKANQLQQAVQQAEEKNERIETLLRELHHRVKNNLQVISGLLSLQSNRVEDDSARRSLEASRTRIEAMALIHKDLYQDKQNAVRVNIHRYLDSLSNSLSNSFGIDPGKIETFVQVDDEAVDIDLAIPLGLIVNELVTNAVKYAFNHNSDDKVMVSLVKREDKLILQVIDHGKNIEPGMLENQHSFGLKLVRTLVRQLNAGLSINQNRGTTFTIEIDAI